MHVSVVTSPDPIITVDEAKAHLRVDFDDDNDLITALVAAATANLDGPEGRLRRSIGVQVLQAELDGFPCHRSLQMPFGPVTTINDVTYVDVMGDSQHLDPDDYTLIAGDRLQLRAYSRWPVTRFRRDPVKIAYTAGYAATPPALKVAILMMVADLYENRESQVVSEGRGVVLPNSTVDRLIAPFRVYRV